MIGTGDFTLARAALSCAVGKHPEPQFFDFVAAEADEMLAVLWSKSGGKTANRGIVTVRDHRTGVGFDDVASDAFAKDRAGEKVFAFYAHFRYI